MRLRPYWAHAAVGTQQPRRWIKWIEAFAFSFAIRRAGFMGSRASPMGPARPSAMPRWASTSGQAWSAVGIAGCLGSAATDRVVAFAWERLAVRSFDHASSCHVGSARQQRGGSRAGSEAHQSAGWERLETAAKPLFVQEARVLIRNALPPDSRPATTAASIEY